MNSNHFTPVECGNASEACQIQGLISDLVFYAALREPTQRIVRLPGDPKLYKKWRRAFESQAQNEVEFKQVLSQLKRYMEDTDAQYGFILTGRGLVPVTRDCDNILYLAQTAKWSSPPSSSAGPRLTLLMALWYLGMLTCDDSIW